MSGIECVRTRLGAPDARGRRTPESIPNSTFTIDVDMVVRAVGQKAVTEFLRPVTGIELRKNGTIVVNERHQTGESQITSRAAIASMVDAVKLSMPWRRGWPPPAESMGGLRKIAAL